MEFLELSDHISAVMSGRSTASFAPCYALYGDDAYLIREGLRMFRELLNPDVADFNYAELSASAENDEILSALNTCPMMDERRVVVIQNYVASKDDFLARYLASPSLFTILVLLMGEDERPPAEVKGINCNHLDVAGLNICVNEILLREPQRKMDTAARTELYTRTLRDMSRIACEVEKLKAYCDSEITVDDVKLLVAEENRIPLYLLSDALGAGNKARALEALDRLIKLNTDQISLLKMIYNYYRRLLHVSLHKGEDNNTLAKMLSVKPGAISYDKNTIAHYTPVRLKKCVDYLHEMQYKVLTGERNKDAAIHETVLTFFTI